MKSIQRPTDNDAIALDTRTMRARSPGTWSKNEQKIARLYQRL